MNIPAHSSTLIQEIYEASYRPEALQIVIERFVKLSRSKSGALFILDRHINQANSFYAYGMNEQVLVDYAHLGQLDPAFAIMEGVAEGEVINIHRPEQHALETEEYYIGMRLKHDIAFVCGANVSITDEQHIGLGLHRSADSSDYEDEVLNEISALIPHLRQALFIRRELIRLRLEQVAMRDCLDAMPIGVVVIDQLGSQVYSNQVAQAILAEHPAIEQKGNTIHPVRNDHANRFRQIVSDCLLKTENSSFDSMHILGLDHPDKEKPLIVYIRSVSNTHENDSFKDMQGRVVIYINDPDRCFPLSRGALKLLFNLSREEAKIAIGLTNGMALNEIADSSHKSINTVRTQLKSLFAKTNTNSQHRLVKLMLKCSMPD